MDGKCGMHTKHQLKCEAKKVKFQRSFLGIDTKEEDFLVDHAEGEFTEAGTDHRLNL
jgi:hypothetical protein